jgi:hemerythrin-like metal-binding protein
MTPIEWRKEYCTGIEGVDYEHEELIAQINALLLMIENRADRELILDGLGEVYGSIAAHFALEEQTMQRHGYDAYLEHQADHERLLDDIRELADEFESADDLDEQHFGERLADWFQHHFQTHDARLHRLFGDEVHKPESVSAMRRMIRDAKRKLLDKRD